MRALGALLCLVSVCVVAQAAPPRAELSRTERPVAGKSEKAKADKGAKADKAKADKGAKADKAKADKAKAAKADKGKGDKGAKAGKARKNGKNAKLCDYQSPVYAHEIIPGETVGAIAGRYGVTSVDIKRWNKKLKNINQIRDGQKLDICPVIPPRERIREEYTVKKGDTFASIAKRHELTQDELLAYQKGRLSDASKLSIGTTLIVWRDGDVVSEFAPESEKGRLTAASRLPPHKAYYIKRPDRVFGTRHAVTQLKGVFERYHKKHKGPPVVMGDLSAKGGGPLSGHVSHQDGRDVDIGWVFKKGKGSQKTFVHGDEDNIDVPRTWALVHELLKTNAVQFIFIDHDIQALLYEEAKKKKVPADQLAQWFQYPRPASRLYGIVRHWKGHADHMHVRFRKE